MARSFTNPQHSRAKLPADSLAALRQLSKILGGRADFVSAFFGTRPPSQQRSAGTGDLKVRISKLQLKRRSRTR